MSNAEKVVFCKQILTGKFFSVVQKSNEDGRKNKKRKYRPENIDERTGVEELV